MDLPPDVNEELLRTMPKRHREDAIQEAWVGFLQAQRDGDNPIEAAEQAIHNYRRQEHRHERRRIELTPKLLNRVSAQDQQR